ncbi:MAG TPA: FHA domain-containing protein [Bryobacteraceae bacterium]
MTASVVANWRACDFEAIPLFSRSEAAAWNVLRRAFSPAAGWQTWIAEGLAAFFEANAGYEIGIRQKHTIDSHQPECAFVFEASELSLGRDENCEIRLTPRSVGNRHARIFAQAGKFYIEDLGSALGTFLNESRLEPNTPARISSGDQFAIFPYSFRIEIAERWSPDAQMNVYAGPVCVQSFPGTTSTDCVTFELQVHPAGAALYLEMSRAFLERMSQRLLAPLCPGVKSRLGLTTADTGFFELLIASVLERINRDLRFPLQVELMPAGPAPQRSIAFSFAVGIAGLTGWFRLLMSEQDSELLGRTVVADTHSALPCVAWAFPLSAGYVDLTSTEIGSIEPGDIVLLTRETALLFPNAPDRGWRVRSEESNISQAVIDKYFERGCLGSGKEELAATGPDLTGLPVRLHAIVGEKEITLSEASQLVAGAILELEGAKSDPIRIALNGKIAGTGELVEVDGRFGVRILSWRAP